MDQIASSPPSQMAQQFRRPPRSDQAQDNYDPNSPLIERLNLKHSLPYLIFLLAVKEAFSRCSIIQVFEYLFLLSTIFVFAVLPYVSLYKKQFILSIQDKESGLNCAQWMALYIFIELFTLKCLPLLSKIMIIAFITLELQCDFSSQRIQDGQHQALRQMSIDNRQLRNSESSQQQRWSSTLKFKLRNSDNIKEPIIHSVVLLVTIIYDAYLLGVFSQSTSIQIKYLLMILLQMFSTLILYQYKLKSYFKTGMLDKDTELLNVKWIANLLLSFGSPMLVFIFNQTPNYSILKFNKDIITLILIVLAISLYFIWNVFQGGSQKIEMHSQQVKRRETLYMVIIVIILSQFIIHTQDSWILQK